MFMYYFMLEARWLCDLLLFSSYVSRHLTFPEGSYGAYYAGQLLAYWLTLIFTKLVPTS